MIKYIIGDVKYIGKDYIILDCNSIGYKVYSSSKSLSSFEINKNYLVYTYLAVREDDLSLYGFFDEKELDFFELLITVSTIGPKGALAILSSMDVNSIVKAIGNNDIKALTKAQGVGKKTASRIILELSDKIDGYEDLAEEKRPSLSSDMEAASQALVNLGYPRADVARVMNRIDTEDRAIEDIIKDAIIALSQR